MHILNTLSGKYSKYLLLSFIINTILFSALYSQDRNGFTLNGFVSGLDSGKMYLNYFNGNKKITDSAVIRKGEFIFKGLLDEPVKAQLSDNKKLMRDDYRNYLSDFYIEPAEMTITLVNNHFANSKLKGSKTNDDYKRYYNELNPVLSSIERLKNEIRLGGKQNITLTDSLVFYKKKSKEISSNFILNHKHSLIAQKAIMELSVNEEIGPDSCLSMLNSLSRSIQHYTTIQKAKAAYVAEISSVPGRNAQDFTRKDVNGKNIRLSSFKGKYVLLDFWASWCIPCRESTPHIKELFAKYNSKGLEVMAVSCDSKYDAWLNAIRADSIERFINILSFTDTDMNFLKTHDKMGDASFEGELRKQFNLMPIPVEILIDRQGVIIGRYGATEKQALNMLDIKLTEIFDGINKL